MRMRVDVGCAGKMKFLSWDHAKRSVKERRLRPKQGRGEMNIYRCRSCHHWHVGRGA